MSAIRAVFFDAVGTLIFPEPAAPVVYEAVGRRFGSRHAAQDIADRFHAAFQKQEAIDRQNGWRTSEERELRRWRDIVAEVLDDVTDPAACFEALYTHFSRPEAWRCTPGIDAVLDTLFEQVIPYGLASNFDARLLALARALRPLRALCRHVVISSEVGFRKPAPEFFHAMCHSTGRAAVGILYVGDDPENDYAGAEATGMSAVLFDPDGKYEDWDGRRIGSLAQLATLLEC